MLTVKIGGYVASQRPFKMPAAKSGEKQKTSISKTQLLIVAYLQYIPLIKFLMVRNLDKLDKGILLVYEGLKIQDGCQSWSLLAAT